MGSGLCFLWQIYEPMSQFFKSRLGQCYCLSVFSGIGGLCGMLRCLTSCRTTPGAVRKARSVVWAKTWTASHGRSCLNGSFNIICYSSHWSVAY